MDVALDEAGKVIKKQKVSEGKVSDSLDKLITLAQQAQQQLAAGSSDAVQQLKAQAEQLGLIKEMNNSTKELHSSINKLSKALDKAFEGQTDICKALKDTQFDQQRLNKVIAEHLYREGRFDLADQFVQEAHVADAAHLKAPYTALHTVLEQIKAHNLGPALEWAQQHRAKLSPHNQHAAGAGAADGAADGAAAADGSGSSEGGVVPGGFEFRLHELNFINTLTSAGQAAALQYAQQHFGPFRARHMSEIQRLMGCLLFVDRSPDDTPYSDLLSATRWDEVAHEFARQACSLMGQSYDSPLAVTLAAGSVALPDLLKLAGVMEKGGQELASCEQLPIEIQLGQEFVFHSIFACPVSRDQSTADNPPKLLPCNHVLCQQSIEKIARSRSRVFKCPYCPMEARPDNTRTLIFPDVL